MWLTDAEQKALLSDTQEKITKAVTSALQGLGIGKIGKMSVDVEKVWELAQRIEARQRKDIAARQHGAATYASQAPKD
jgi:hypothetical protein